VARVALLIYQTDDGEFADRAIAVLGGVGIRAFREGYGQDETTGSGSKAAANINIFLEKPSDYVRANEVLVNLGAAVDKPLNLPRGNMVRLLLLAIGAAVAMLLILTLR
jgi:hypothetical protein